MMESVMPSATITHLTLPKVARLAGISPAAAWLKAKAGEYGPLSRNDRGWHLVSAKELERRLGIKFSPAQIAAAAAAPAFINSKKRRDELNRRRAVAQAEKPSTPALDLAMVC